MSKYVDGFVIPIKKKNVKIYKKIATKGRNVWMKHGALDYYECVGTKIKNDWGIPFNRLCKLKSDETIIFAFIVYKSKAHRDTVNKKVHKEFASAEGSGNLEMPFDMKRFSAGEFKTIAHS